MLAKKLKGVTEAQEDKLYVDDVFSTHLYTGNGSAQTINNGIALADSLNLKPGDSFGGGYVVGEFGGYLHILADKDAESLLPWTGMMHDTGPRGTSDSKLNTDSWLSLGGNLVVPQYARNYREGGFDDWDLPASDVLYLVWLNLNPNGADTPAVFKAGGVQAMNTSNLPYWTSTRVTYGIATRTFSNGRESYVETGEENFPVMVRPVRRVQLSDPALDPHRVRSEGGLVWLKGRTVSSGEHNLYDTLRGAGKSLNASNTLAENAYGHATGLTSFNPSGFQVGIHVDANRNLESFVSWTFRRAPKFFDIVTYTGNGVAGRQIPHGLGIAPGMIVVKRLDGNTNWGVYHRATGPSAVLTLNTTAAQNNSPSYWGDGATDSHFELGSGSNVNNNGAQYVAYLWAHDDSEDGIIQCGSARIVGSNANVVLGWEPQFVLFKAATGTSAWYLADSMRGMHASEDFARLNANTSGAEIKAPYITINAAGFSASGASSGADLIYLAIRRPNKPPTSGTEVFAPSLGNIASNPPYEIHTSGFPVDLWLRRYFQAPEFYDRLRGNSVFLTSSSTAPESSSNEGGFTNRYKFDSNTGVNSDASLNSQGRLGLMFRRAPGFFDVVCYTERSGVVPHNLTVRPELIIVKERSATDHWYVWTSLLNTGSINSIELHLNDTSAATHGSGLFAASSVTASSFIPINNIGGSSGTTAVAYLFASLSGISKIGSYVGNGTTQTIDCAFSTGARFILIKRTDTAGDWYVWDSARGIVAAKDPHLSLNTTAAEVTTDDSVDPAPEGFIVNQVAATNINVNNASYIFLSIA